MVVTPAITKRIEKKTDTIKAKGHELKLDHSVAPTCTEDGYDVYTCNNCDGNIQYEFCPSRPYVGIQTMCMIKCIYHATGI